MEIRKASAKDRAAVRRLCRELGYEQSEEEIDRKIRAMAGSSTDLLLLAVVEQSAAGLINMAVVETIESPPFAEVRALVVSHPFRNRRIGEALVHAGESWARDQGLDRIRVRTRVERTDAHRFYQRIGYELVKQQKVLDKNLQETEGSP